MIKSAYKLSKKNLFFPIFFVCHLFLLCVFSEEEIRQIKGRAGSFNKAGLDLKKSVRMAVNGREGRIL